MVAQLFPIPIVSPGSRGVNFEEENALLDPRWATVAQEAKIDTNGRLAARNGYTNLTTTAITSTPDVKTIFEYIQEDGTTENIVAWNGGIANDTADPESNDISGSVTDTDGTWWFQNYLDQCWGFQDGQKPIVYTGSGTFATVSESAGTAPTIADGVGLCAYGRVWGLDSDKQTIKFSVLLDGTDWSSSGSGSINMTNIWTHGTDQVTAIAAFNGFLVVFGHNHVVIWEDTTGSQLGLDPANMVVRDVIGGVGCESQWTIQNIANADMWFFSRHGLQSLGRLIIQKSAPLGSLDDKVRAELQKDYLATTDLTELRSVVDPELGAYILSFPTAARTWVIFFKRPFVDETTGKTLYPITTWPALVPTAWARITASNKTYLGGAGIIGQYGTVSLDDATAYILNYESGWLTFGSPQGQDKLKILKRIHSIIFTLTAATVIYKWDFDFQQSWTYKSIDYSSEGSAEWGEAEWGASEWSGSISLRQKKIPGSGTGQYVKVGLTVEVGSEFAIQQLELMSKLGRSS